MATLTVNATKDASALQNNDGWSGWDDHHPVGMSPSGNKYCSFIYFPLNMAGWTGITDATLHIRGHRAGSGNHVLGSTSGNTRTLHVRRMTSDWGEGTNRGETNWSSAEAWGWTNRRTASASGGTDINFTGYSHDVWYLVNITSIVNEWRNGSPNYGIILYLNGAEESSSSDALEFYARDAGSSFAPYLTIDYTTNTAPNAPTGLSPSSDALVNTLTPNLTAGRSDPDFGDYITAYQILVYADDGTTLIWDSGTVAQSGTSITFSKTYAGPGLTGNTFYKWKARTRDKGAAWGPYSGLARFKVNTPPSPPSIILTSENPLEVFTLTPSFTLTHVDNDVSDNQMFGYHIILETSTGTAVWDSGDIDISGSPLHSYTFTYSGPTLSWATQYRIRARTKDSNGVWGAYSSNYLFYERKTKTPINLDPANEESVSTLTPVLHTEHGSSGDYITEYQIIVRTEDGQTTLWDSGVVMTGINNGEATDITYAGSALSYNTRYAWFARHNGVTGGFSEFSLAFFNTPVDASVPQQNFPTPNSAGRVTSLTPTLSGSRTSAFTHYQIQLYAGTATSSNLGTPIWDTGDLTQSSATTFSKVYDGPTLTWNTNFKWRVRVGAPTLGGWSGLALFTTSSAGAPILVFPAHLDWITDATPTLTGTTSGGENATGFKVYMFELVNSVAVYIWDSGWVSQSPSTSFSYTYDGPALTPGRIYGYNARYRIAGDIEGPAAFGNGWFLNGPPKIPTNLSPVPGTVLNDNVTPLFKATFDDPERLNLGDFPTEWHIEIRLNSTDALVQEKVLTAGLTPGLNEYQWGTNTGGSDSGLSYDTLYKWRTWYTDSKGEDGAPSGYQIFSAGHPPEIEIISPSNGSNINTTRPLVTWSYDDPNDSPQMKFRIWVYRLSTMVRVYDSGERVSSDTSFQIPTGYLRNNDEEYLIQMYVIAASGLPSNGDSSTVQLELAAPPRLEGLSATVYEDQSKIVLDWDAAALGANFVTYVIYRKAPSDDEWTMIGTRKPQSNVTYVDWYAGQKREYNYRVTVVKKIANEPDLESPDSDIVTAQLVSDVWFVVGNDRSEEHIFELPVNSESHNRPVQQEEFEPIGSNRKAVVRGFVLGHEGSVDVTFFEEESAIARQRIEYLLYYAGPHILKNPFGDVFDVTFGSPDYQYLPAGNMEATLTWIETGATNNPGLTPDQYLAQIGAE